MKKINNFFLGLFVFLMAIMLSNCAASHQYNFTLKNTLAIFLLNDDKNYYFCIPVQYMGDYQLGKFDFNGGNITIGEYEILLNRNDLNISMYLNESTDEEGNFGGGFNLIYSEEKGEILLSNIDEPLTIIQPLEPQYNHYYIFIEKFLNDDEIKNIIGEFKKGNVNSRFRIGYDLVINNELQNGNGILDDFEIYNGVAMDPAYFPPNLDFFKTKYLH